MSETMPRPRTDKQSVPRQSVGEPADVAPFDEKPEGPVAAAMLSGGVGALALGLLTTLAEASAGLKEWLTWSAPVGPLSGKTGLAVIVWLVAWAALHLALRRRAYETRRILVVTVVLIGLGVLGTFPTFFEAFAAE